MYRFYCSGVRWSGLCLMGFFALVGQWVVPLFGVPLLALVELALELPSEIETLT